MKAKSLMFPIALAVLMIVIVGCYTCGSSSSMNYDFTGQHQEEIFNQFDEPKHRFVGHYGSVEQSYVDRYPDVTTYVFETKDGSVYVTIDESNKKCISSDLLEKGASW